MALKDKLMTLEDFKAVRDVDVASNTAQFTEIKADLANNVNDLKNTITNITGYEAISFTNRKYIKTNLNVGDLVDLTPITAYNTNNYAIVDAQEGDKFTINATGGNAGRLWCFVDSNNVLLSVAVSGAIATNLVLTAPANASKLILNPVSGYGKIYKGEYLVDVTNGLENHVNALNTSVGTLAEELNGVRADVGDLSNLDTTDKSSIVAAINEAAQTGGGGGSGSSTLSGLTDTSISGKADGQVLTYDGTSNKWVNRAPSGGGSVTVDTSLSGTSTNPVQNKVIKQALDTKAGIAVATTSANGLMSATDKSHLDSVYADYSAAIAALGA